MTHFDLDRIRVQTPCQKSWAEMPGDERKRFCDSCSLHVHNLSALTRAEGQALVARESQGRLCVTYLRRPDGTVLTADPRERAAPAALRWLWTRSAALAASMPLLASLAALLGCRQTTSPEPAAPPAADPTPCTTELGDVALPPPADSTELRVLGEMPAELGRVAAPASAPESPKSPESPGD
jgi:hypothetical protein